MKKLLLFSTSLCLWFSTKNTIAQCASPSSVSNANLLSHYQFNNGSGTDISGNNLNLTMFGNNSTTNKVGVVNKAVSLSGGSSAGGSVPNSSVMNMTNQITISAWFNSANIALTQRVVDKIAGTITNNFMLDMYQSKLRFFVATGAAQSTTTLQSNTWYHVVATYDGSNARIYLNSVLDKSNAVAGTMTVNAYPLCIGRDQSGSNNFAGKIDDIKIYSRVLNTTEITDLYQTPDFDVEPAQMISLCSNMLSITAHAISTGTNVTYKWKKGATYLSDNSTYSGTSTNILVINNGTPSEYGKYELEAYSQNCIVSVSDTANVVSGSVSSLDNTGLILNYPFNNYSGKDKSGNNFHAIIVNGSTGADQNNNSNSALNLFSNAYAYTPNNALMNLTNQLTVSCWFNSSNIMVTQRLIDKLSGTTTGNFCLDIYQGKLRFFCGVSGMVTNTLVLNSNTWYHVSATYDGNFMRLYLNGASLSTGALTGNLNQNLSSFIIGGDQVGTSRFGGLINDVRFYSRVLSPSEINGLTLTPENIILNTNQTFCLGQNASIVTYASPSNASFQWKKNGVFLVNGGNISGVNSATLNVNNISAIDYDMYSCDVTSSTCIEVSSNTIALSQQFNTTVSNNNLAVYYPFSNSPWFDMSGNGNNFSTYAGITTVSDRDNITNQALSFDGASSFINTQSSPLMYSNNSQVTFAMWIKPINNADQRLVEKFQSYYLDFNSGQVRIILNTGYVYNTGYQPAANTWQHIVASYDGNAMKFYVNGVMTYSFSQPGVIISQNNSQLQLGYANGGNPYRYNGSMDEFKMYTRGLNGQEVFALYKTGSLTQQPASTIICGNGSATLNTSIVSANPVDYQWYYNGNILNGETTNSLSLANVTSNNLGGYYCTYTTQCTILSTDTAVVNLLSPNTLSPTVTPSVLCVGGGNIILSSTEFAPAGYIWTAPNGNIGTNQNINVNTTTSKMYTLTVSSGTCSAQSTVSVTVMSSAPSISVTSTSSLMCSGQTATLTANGVTSYTWNTGSFSLNIAVSPTTTTLYTVTGRDNYGCQNSISFQQNVSVCTDINVQKINNMVSIYPNPVKDIITLYSDTELGLITLVDVLGNTVVTTKTNSYEATLNLSDLKKGVYFIYCNNYAKKIIKD